jgi:adenylate cyclase
VTTVGNDHRFTPVGDMDGVEMHANAIANILQRTFTREVPEWINLVVLCALGALIAPFAAALPLPRASLAAAVLLVAYGVLNIWLYTDHFLVLHFVGPSVGLSLTAFAILIERGLIEEREKRRIQSLLRRYVSPQIASYVMANPQKCFLGGDRVTATVLFSDIRGFTALSEKLTPEQAVARLNEYLQVMANVVFLNEGTVDKYIGDGIMALFGVPVPHDDHARRAVRTALDMQTSLLKMQDQWRAQGLPELEIGIGINTGEMVVGNIGAIERQDFTVIGDSVNLASRVEGLTKELGGRILITEATYALVKDEAEVRGPFEAQVKGKAEAVTVYEVHGWRDARE